MQRTRHQGDDPAAGTELVRSSFVPLYYQLQELLKQQIESGTWGPGDMLPSEPEIARRYGVSRVVVRQALAILEDDHQIVRVRGRGTIVMDPKIDIEPGGLMRFLATAREPDVTILVLDKRTPAVERSIRTSLGGGDIRRVTTLVSVRRQAIAIMYSFFRQQEMAPLEAELHVGGVIAPDVVLSRYGLALSGGHVSIETSHCGRFEADRFGIPPRSAVFLVHAVEHAATAAGDRMLEFTRAEYRGDKVQLAYCASTLRKQQEPPDETTTNPAH